jgi:hypothetical protein
LNRNTLAEAVIEAASQVKNHATLLFDAYVLLPQLLDKEERAIRAADFDAVAAAGADKAAAADAIERAFHALAALGERLARLVGSASDGVDPPRRIASLKDCLAALVELAASLEAGAWSPSLGSGMGSAGAAPSAGLGVQVLRHQIDGIRRLTVGFDEQVPKVQPKIASNKILLQTLLESYQESYRFWQAVTEETAVSYNARGVQQAAGRTSAFRARA